MWRWRHGLERTFLGKNERPNLLLGTGKWEENTSEQGKV